LVLHFLHNYQVALHRLGQQVYKKYHLVPPKGKFRH
jgi:hypothetical protein